MVSARRVIPIGDDPAALAARERLAPLLERIEDPFLRAVSHLTMAWTSPILGDFDAALRQASASLSLAAHSTHNVSLFLAASARLAFAQGDPEQAALLAGTAQRARTAGAFGPRIVNSTRQQSWR